MVEKYCNECQGKGWKLKINQMLMPIRVECEICDGSGYVLEESSDAPQEETE